MCCAINLTPCRAERTFADNERGVIFDEPVTKTKASIAAIHFLLKSSLEECAFILLSSSGLCNTKLGSLVVILKSVWKGSRMFNLKFGRAGKCHTRISYLTAFPSRSRTPWAGGCRRIQAGCKLSYA